MTNPEIEMLKMQHSQEIDKLIRERDELALKLETATNHKENIVAIVDTLDDASKERCDGLAFTFNEVMESPHGWLYRIRCEASA